MFDGYLNKCKECTKGDVEKRRILKIYQIRKYDRERGKTDHRKKLQKVYSLKESFRKKRSIVIKRWVLNNIHKKKATTILGNAVRDKRITKKNCLICGNLKTHGHHDDYTRPLYIMWLCPLHHKLRHKTLETKCPF